MRLGAILTLVLTLLALAGAAYLPPPFWQWALVAVPVLAALCAVHAAAAVVEWIVGPDFRAAAPLLAFAFALFGVLHAVFEGPPGALPPGLPMQHLPVKALSLAALGALLGAVRLGIHGLGARGLGAQALALATLVAAAWALGTSARAAGIPFLSPWALGLAAAGGGLALAAAARDRASLLPVTEEEEPPAGSAPPADEPRPAEATALEGERRDG